MKYLQSFLITVALLLIGFCYIQLLSWAHQTSVWLAIAIIFLMWWAFVHLLVRFNK